MAANNKPASAPVQGNNNNVPATQGAQAPQTDAKSARKTLLEAIEGWAYDLLKQRLSEDVLHEASGRLALALRVTMQLNPKIGQCTPESIAQCVAMSALTGLMPGGVHPRCYLIPRNQRVKTGQKDARGKDVWVDRFTLSWQISYHGYEELAQRAGWGVQAIALSASDVFRQLEAGDNVVTVAGRQIVTTANGKTAALITLVTGEMMVLERNIDDPPQEWLEIRGVLLKCEHKTNGSIVWGYSSRKHIEKRVRSSESVKTAITNIAKRLDGLKPDEYKRPSESAMAKARMEPTEKLLGLVDGPWRDWTVEMVLKTGVTALLSDNIIHLPDAMKWAVQEDKKASVVDDDEYEDTDASTGTTGASSSSSRAALDAPRKVVEIPMSSGMDGLESLVGDEDEGEEIAAEAEPAGAATATPAA